MIHFLEQECCLESVYRFQIFFQKSLKEEQRECIRRMFCLKEDIVVVLLTRFTVPNILEKMHRSTSTDWKMFLVVVSPLEYIRTQQVVNPKKSE